MHQDHNIAWNALASHFKISRGPNKTMPLNFYPCHEPTLSKSITYFSNTLIKTIREFATTERKKYPSTFPSPEKGDLFPDDLIDSSNERYPHSQPQREYLNHVNQKIEHWIDCYNPKEEREQDRIHYYGYYLLDSSLANTINILLAEGQMYSILMLANHKTIGLKWMFAYDRTQACVHGWGELARKATCAYIFVNLLAEFPEYCQGMKYQNLAVYSTLLQALYWGDGEGVIHSWLRVFRDGQYQYEDIFGDMERLKEYLKTCFAVMYRCETLAREHGFTVPWESYIRDALSFLNIISYYAHDGLYYPRYCKDKFKYLPKSDKSSAPSISH
ncbi:hypothetical protein BGZ76_000949 [Entomortierella beljakovae]|nr:hypothetical protein BGZ76_000949 [Entomortierella beljakovae]